MCGRRTVSAVCAPTRPPAILITDTSARPRGATSSSRTDYQRSSCFPRAKGAPDRLRRTQTATEVDSCRCCASGCSRPVVRCRRLREELSSTWYPDLISSTERRQLIGHAHPAFPRRGIAASSTVATVLKTWDIMIVPGCVRSADAVGECARCMPASRYHSCAATACANLSRSSTLWLEGHEEHPMILRVLRVFVAFARRGANRGPCSVTEKLLATGSASG